MSPFITTLIFGKLLRERSMNKFILSKTAIWKNYECAKLRVSCGFVPYGPDVVTCFCFFLFSHALRAFIFITCLTCIPFLPALRTLIFLSVFIFVRAKFLSDGEKTSLFFFREPQLITVLPLICDSYMSWSTRFFPLKLCGISIPFGFYQSLYFSSTKWMHSLTLKRYNNSF